MHWAKLFAAITAAALVASVGCTAPSDDARGGGADTPTKVEQQVKQQKQRTPDDGTTKAYMEAVTSSEPAELKSAMEEAAPNSSAHAYLEHQANVANATLDGGIPSYDDSDLRPSGAAFELCSPDEDGEESCLTYDNFELDEGKVAGFTIDDTDIGSRITVGNGEPIEAQGVDLEFLTAYKAMSDALYVTLKVTSGSQPVSMSIASYRSPDGSQRDSTMMYGPTELDKDSTATMAFVFDGVEPGGSMNLEGCLGDLCDPLEAKLKVG